MDRRVHPARDGRRIVKTPNQEGQATEPYLFGVRARTELVLADLLREAIQDNPSGAGDHDLSGLYVPRALGPLEAEVLEVVWKKTEATVRDVYRVLSRSREIAYTTVLTVLRNLNRKNIVRRRQGDVGYIYYPAIGREEFIQARVGEIIDLLLDRFPGPTLTHLLRRMGREKG